ncbi:DUF4185 domain-containing protein [Actinopolymorpha rutila]|uniref:DUF4185 domain-containing protein n=1 Tax=Actinopolymorpha rutila TaxID=446787 RepID=A0A852Z4H6_9ACTN|nr:DUF4185 domain-containing protein [Actinopolymorpha rutila]NYH87731.1 hypothetical protein [Actinopolymorpha rutila]
MSDAQHDDGPAADAASRRSARVSRRGLLLGGASTLAATGVTGAAAPFLPAFAASPAAALVEVDSRFFATSSVPYADELDTESDGDLWPTAWADDGALYTANGDGRGFSDEAWSDIVVNRIDGTPETGLSGVRLTAGDDIVRIWSDPANFNRKPTGMVAVDGNGDGRDELYLAVQDLRRPPDPGAPGNPHAFNEAPAATIVRSTDYGRTWQPTSEPMFTDHIFTTVFFCDFGQSNSRSSMLGRADAGYVYAYGLDNNWRDSFSGIVDDPLDLWLARAPIGSILDRSTWQFFAGVRGGRPTWSRELGDRVAVLHDERRVYPGAVTEDGNSVLSQGCVVYNPGLKRFLYLSWTEYTYEFYEAPAPWGPWKLFQHKDFGPYPWWGSEPGTPGPKNGGYATVAPSKFVSADGRQLWVQSNWFVGTGHPRNNYNFSLRRLSLEPYHRTSPAKPPDPAGNLVRTAPGTVVVDKTCHYGRSHYLNDGRTDLGEDSWDGSAKEADRWGYIWPRAYHLNRLVYTTGTMFPDGGWFDAADGGLRVQVRREHRWTDVRGLRITPDYPYDDSAGSYQAYTLTFTPTWGDGIRLVGRPGGPAHFTSIAELEVFYDPAAQR